MLARKHRYTIFIGYGAEAGGILKHYEQLKYRLGIGTNTLFLRFLLDFYEQHKPDSTYGKEIHFEPTITDEQTVNLNLEEIEKSSKHEKSSSTLNKKAVESSNCNFLNESDVNTAVTALGFIDEDSTDVQCKEHTQCEQTTTTTTTTTIQNSEKEIKEVAKKQQKPNSQLNVTTQDALFENSDDKVTSSDNIINKSPVENASLNDRENNTTLPNTEAIEQLDEPDSDQQFVDNHDAVEQIEDNVGPSSSKCSKLEVVMGDKSPIAKLV